MGPSIDNLLLDIDIRYIIYGYSIRLAISIILCFKIWKIGFLCTMSNSILEWDEFFFGFSSDAAYLKDQNWNLSNV